MAELQFLRRLSEQVIFHCLESPETKYELSRRNMQAYMLAEGKHVLEFNNSQGSSTFGR